MADLLSHSDVIDAFGGPSGFAVAVSIPASHARTMKARNSIPVDHWPATVAAAEQAAPPIIGVTLELLSRLRAQQLADRGRDASGGTP